PDETLYHRVFAELFLYLKQDRPTHPWQVVIIYPRRSVERLQESQFADLLALRRVRRIYLDELGAAAADALGAGVVKLVIASEEAAPEQAKQLIARAKEQLDDASVRSNLINLIETIIVYKLPQKSREEIAAMLGLLSELKETRFYQEVFEEGRLEGIEEGLQRGVSEGKSVGIEEGRLEAKRQAIAPMLDLNLSLEVIARVLDLPLAEVEQIAAQVRQETILKTKQQTITKFIELLIHQRALFADGDLTQLEQLIDLLPDDMEVLFQVISRWLERHPELQRAHATLMESTDEVLTESRDRQQQNLPNKQALQAAILGEDRAAEN
ncbi:MAG: Rpn family recombination-promoting nuclease/putative transposase, partial [Microcoleus sp.]